MENFKKIDFENWNRKEHYKYYTEKLKVGYSMTVSLDVTNIVNFCKKNNIKFFNAFIYCVGKVINSTDNLRMFKDKDGMPCVWNKCVPNYTIFHKDDETFSDLWSDFDFDFEVFSQNMNNDIKTYGNIKGIKAKENQPPNFFCISCVPWINFTAYTAYTAESTPAFFPIITYGKYVEENGRLKMPFNMSISHAVCDGYHAAKFFNNVQKEIDDFENLIK